MGETDLISRQAVIDAIVAWTVEDRPDIEMPTDLVGRIEALPSAYPERCECCETLSKTQLLIPPPEQRWIPIKWHDCTDEDREKYGFNNDIVVVFDCEMPDDNQSILVTTSHGYINQDVCYIDDGYSLDSGWDWIDDIKAWMPLPEPYKGEQE